MSYLYDASGEKLRMSATGRNFDYISGIHYENGEFAFAQTEMGRVTRNGSGTDPQYLYEYTINDHLGNGRLYFDINAGVARKIQETDYYAYGMAVQASSILGSENRYQYNGKEKQDELKMFDYGARFYDPIIGRWNVVDKLSDEPEQIDKSSYAYGWNNPVKNTDPDGNCPSCLIGGIVGAIVDYGEQVAANALEGKSNPFTNNINLVSIGTSAVAGFLTSGGSVIGSTGAKLAVKAGASLINNTVKVTTSSTGLKTEVETKAVNVIKNTAIDLGADKVIGKLGGKVEGALSKVSGTNAGRLSNTSKAVVKALGGNVTRATTATVKAGLKVATKVTTKTIESGAKASTNSRVDELKTKTNQK